MANFQALGKRIRQARREIGYRRRRDLARDLGLPEKEIAEVEKGLKAPPHRLIGFLSHRLGVSPRALIWGDLKRENLLFRHRGKIELTEKEKAQIWTFRDLLETLEEAGLIRCAHLNFQASGSPEEAARKFIEHFGLKSDWFNTWPDVLAVLSRKGVFVFGLPLRRGSAIVHLDHPFFIVLNSREPEDRWSFSLFHEIAHLSAPEDLRDNEPYANTFASYVLIPEGMRYELWQNLRPFMHPRGHIEFYQRVRNLSPYVSPEAVYYTLINTFGGPIHHFNDFKKLCASLRDREEKKLSGVLYTKRILDALDEAVKRGLISRGRRRELLFS